MVVQGGSYVRPSDGQLLGDPESVDENGYRTYELWFEDIPKVMNPDYDHDDFVVRVTELPGNKHKIFARKGNAGFKFNVVDQDGGLLFADVGGGGVEFELSGGTASYGMNREVNDMPTRLMGKSLIFFMDYERISAVVNDQFFFRDDWDTWRNDSGQVTFARHFGKCNIMFMTGEVRLMHPDGLDPAISSKSLEYWLPDGAN